MHCARKNSVAIIFRYILILTGLFFGLCVLKLPDNSTNLHFLDEVEVLSNNDDYFKCDPKRFLWRMGAVNTACFQSKLHKSS